MGCAATLSPTDADLVGNGAYIRFAQHEREQDPDPVRIAHRPRQLRQPPAGGRIQVLACLQAELRKRIKRIPFKVTMIDAPTSAKTAIHSVPKPIRTIAKNASLTAIAKPMLA